MITEADCAWLAGFLDGEGSITLYRSVWKWKENGRRLKNHQKEPERYRALIAVVNSHRPTGERIKALYEEMGVKSYFLKKVRRGSFSQRDMWTINVMSHRSAKRLLEFVRPYLFTKQVEADALWRWIEIAEARDPHLAYTDEQREIACFLRKRSSHGNPQPSSTGAAEAE